VFGTDIQIIFVTSLKAHYNA